MENEDVKSKLNDNVLIIIIASLITILTLVLIGMVTFSLISNKGGSVLLEDDEKDVWYEAFSKVERERVGIKFRDIKTANKDYEFLSIRSQTFVDTLEKLPDVVVTVDTKIDEKTYVDGKTKKQIVLPGGNKSEAGPIYLHNKLINRYMNSDGEIDIVGATLNYDKNYGATVVTLKDIPKAFNSELPHLISENGVISEDEYLEIIGDIVIKLIQSKDTNELTEYQKKALNYFTFEGNRSVLGNKENIMRTYSKDLQIVYMEAGKSSINAPKKDRIYMQIRYEVNSGDIRDRAIILKLNENSRIFDIDII